MGYQNIPDATPSSSPIVALPTQRRSLSSFAMGLLLGLLLGVIGVLTPGSPSPAATLVPTVGSSKTSPRVSTTQSFDMSDAKKYFDFSASTYCIPPSLSSPYLTPSQVSKIKSSTGISVLNGTRVAPTDLAVVLGTENDGTGIVMSFRGSQTPINMLSDLLAWKSTASLGKGCQGCELHAGIMLDYKSISSPALSLLRWEVEKLKGGRKGRGMGRGKKNDPITVTITGHSLGGALAALTAFEYVQGLGVGSGVKVRVFTFGEPRLGNDKFAEAYGGEVDESWRVVNKGDIISHIPMQSFGYEHEGTEVWMESGGVYEVCQGGEDPNCSNSLSWLLDINEADHTKGWFGEQGGADGTMCSFLP
ncbi:hypothetical protein TrRE_jg11443 [Triparma retinervis]|uniref:Fungal lipase-type domain-containing protein n=1 Tax=Triparma retinervis TaxID=2557542 RepID=A0A9W7G2N8_9STRA|nr:hypothetical protein TrRE_jg11443 [Triparma retinervis]